MSSGDEEALRLADLFECIPIASGSLDNIESAGRELRRLVAEREADRAVMREALEALKYHTEQTRPITATQVAIHSLQKRLAPPSQA